MTPRPKTVKRAVSIKPHTIINTTTGELDNHEELYQNITALINHVQAWSQNELDDTLQELPQEISNLSEKPRQPAELARQTNHQIDYAALPKAVKQKSRINKLAGANYITAALSYHNNPNQHKRPPRAPAKVMLSAADKQLCSLSYDEAEHTITLHWHCWEGSYLITFVLPSYTRERRQVAKWCLPDVRLDKRTGEPVFTFSYEEFVSAAPRSGLVAGIDLGKAKPFVAVVANERGGVVAQYGASGRLREGWARYKRRREECVFLARKLKRVEALGLDGRVLRVELERTRARSTRAHAALVRAQGAEVAARLLKHRCELVRVEDLSWVQGARYGGRWSHARQQAAISDGVERGGARVVRVNARNTSQVCHRCHAVIVHDERKRSVWCDECRQSWDRDFNAALNILRDLNACCPGNWTRIIGGTCSAHAGKRGAQGTWSPGSNNSVAGGTPPPIGNTT